MNTTNKYKVIKIDKKSSNNNYDDKKYRLDKKHLNNNNYNKQSLSSLESKTLSNNNVNKLSLIKVKNLDKKFDNKKVLENISFEINKKGIVGILGPNGVGKTTLMKILTCQIEKTKGEAKVIGLNVEDFEIQIKENIGILPEQESPPDFLTVNEYLEFICKIRNLNNSKVKINKFSRLFHFEAHLDELIKHLSRGTKQKIMLCQTFIHEPKIAFIDEPLVNLDPIIQEKVKSFFIDYSKENLILLTTHNLSIIGELCDRTLILNNKKIKADINIDSKNKTPQGIEKLKKEFLKYL